MSKENDIFMNLGLIDKIVWEQATSDTETIIIMPSRDDTYDVMSKTGYKSVSHFANYKINNDHIDILQKSKVETIVLLSLPNYQELAFKLINEGYTIVILNQSIKDITNSTIDSIHKSIKTKSTPYYDYIYSEFARSNDVLTFPAKLESFLTQLIEKIDFNRANHIPFNNFLIHMLGLDNGCGEPLLFNLIKKSLITTLNKRGK
ncbi:hypothetical protein GTA51_04795 [Desulfovibrio aerotolerans]|uniref:Uncharacterized protein n=1 Tax=Solidesulfovibrio aerotolerans TaxID=295255 RepID=A0A7C9NIF6_9BACT|nr:hypothetical protein [Solidesulfovibrio aerotolerans]MYL82456.1 hypothetical protein [Solidesulfovibrio aerotolerans]